jgi:hypothetical protein
MTPIINFYPRSRNVIAHICQAGQVHVCVSDWLSVLDGGYRVRDGFIQALDHPTDGTMQARQDTQ